MFISFVPYRREVLEIWKQRKGEGATYRNLIIAFTNARCCQYADFVKKICSKLISCTASYNRNYGYSVFPL